MKQKRDRAIPREGPPCRRCGRPTQPRSNWERLTIKLPWAEWVARLYHHLCTRCYRKMRPNDCRAVHHPRGHRSQTVTTATQQAKNGDVAASHAPPLPSQARTPPVLDAPGRMMKEVGNDRIPYWRCRHRAVCARRLGAAPRAAAVVSGGGAVSPGGHKHSTIGADALSRRRPFPLSRSPWLGGPCG